MKKIILFLVIVLTSCEEVVNIPLETAKPKLVVDASIKWQKGTAGNEQLIKLSNTSNFYNNNIPKVSNAIVFITDDNGMIYNFIEDVANAGNYWCYNFTPELNLNYTLTIIYNGETFTANEKLMPCPNITNIEQNNNGGFTGEDIEVKYFFDDIVNEENYYLFRFESSENLIPELDVLEDTFFQNNEMFAYYSNEKLKTGTNLDFTLYGISKNYYNYVNIILGIAGNNGGSPFTTPPATVRGNIINQTNFDNFALGYFNLSETDVRNYIVE